MITVRADKKGSKPFHLTMRDEEILKAVYFYRYLTALDVTHLLFSLGSRKYVRDLLTDLAGGVDGANNQYLYRFLLPTAGKGNAERIYTLGSKGRDFLANDVGLPVTWYYRPDKVKHHSHRHILHNLLLTRFLVAAKSWSKTQPQVRLAQTRICYELLKTPVTIAANKGGGTETINVTPDAWLLFENLKDGQHDQWMPILLEIDRGMEYQQKFKQHVRGRIEFIDSGAYSRIFANKAVVIAYATAGQTPEYRETRRRTMCTWTKEVLTELHKEDWASVFRFTSLDHADLYDTPLFHAPVWYRPDSLSPVPLFPI